MTLNEIKKQVKQSYEYQTRAYQRYAQRYGYSIKTVEVQSHLRTKAITEYSEDLYYA